MSLTTNIKLDTPAHGADVDTWDQPLNANAVILDATAGSITTKSLTNANVTLSTTESQVSILRFTGTLTGNCIITLGAIIKSWIVENLTLGGFYVQLSGGSGNVVGLPPGSCQVYWDGTNVKFINLGAIGSYWDWSGGDTPSWVNVCSVPPAIKCDGSTFNAVTYPILNLYLGGNTLPDFRGRGAFYLNGTTGRITTAGSGIDGDSRFSAGGAQNVTLDTTMIPSHTHTNSPHTHGVSTGSFDTVGGSSAGLAFGGNFFFSPASISATGITIDSTGGGLAHNNMPPAVMSGVRMIWAG